MSINISDKISHNLRSHAFLPNFSYLQYRISWIYAPILAWMLSNTDVPNAGKKLRFQVRKNIFQKKTGKHFSRKRWENIFQKKDGKTFQKMILDNFVSYCMFVDI